MGGTVAETIRTTDGEVIKMARKTGAYNWMFFSKEFNDETNHTEKEAIEKHCKSFFDMKEDFDSGEPYKLPMSPVYGWCKETCPIDYGLVVIDFQNKKVHSMQGYDSPGMLQLSHISPYIKYDIDTENGYKFLIDNNLLYTLDKDKNEFVDIHTFFGKKITYEDVLEMNSHSITKEIKDLFFQSKISRDDLFFINFVPKKLLDFENKNYEETPEGLFDFFNNLKKDDFIFNDEEKKMWKEKMKDFDLDCFLLDSDSEDIDEDILEKRKNIMLDKMDAETKITNKMKRK